MTDIKINTYTNGFDFVLCNQLTKDGMVKLCQLLDMRFGDGNVFVPEGISDGFILWVDWPGKSAHEMAYKCIRQHGENRNEGRWPWVVKDAKTAWAGNIDIALTPGKYSTFLKSFYTAPAWTVDELRIVKECLEEKGFNVMRMPSLRKRRRVMK